MDSYDPRFAGFEEDTIPLGSSCVDEHGLYNTNCTNILAGGDVDLGDIFVDFARERESQAVQDSAADSFCSDDILDLDSQSGTAVTTPDTNLGTESSASLDAESLLASIGIGTVGIAGETLVPTQELSSLPPEGGSLQRSKQSSRKRKRNYSTRTEQEKLKENERLRKYRRDQKEGKRKLQEKVEHLQAENVKLKAEHKECADKLIACESDKASWKQLYDVQTSANMSLHNQLLREQEINRVLLQGKLQCLWCSYGSAPAV